MFHFNDVMFRVTIYWKLLYLASEYFFLVDLNFTYGNNLYQIIIKSIIFIWTNNYLKSIIAILEYFYIFYNK